jgi:hypothetical protein
MRGISKVICLVVFFVLSLSLFCFADEQIWKFNLIWESKPLTNFPFALSATGDLDHNGVKELIIADFGYFGERAARDFYNLFVFEWDNKGLKKTWGKQWDLRKIETDVKRYEYFSAFEARQLVTWSIGSRTMTETIPPYLGLEWIDGKYILQEQSNSAKHQAPLVGSWAMPWLTSSCYQGFENRDKIFPRECLVGIRDFEGKGKPKIVTILEEEIIKDKEYKQILRVRKFEPEFSIEWEMSTPIRLVWNDPQDRLNWNAVSGLLLREFKTVSWFLFELNNISHAYQLKPLQIKESRGIETYNLPDVYLRSTQKKSNEEYWGYYKTDVHSSPQGIVNFNLLPRKVMLKPDLSGFRREDIHFQEHKPFLGIGYFDLKDIDGDGLEEVILIEETGKRNILGEESIEYSDTKDYLRILKWNGKEYQTMWVSPPYTKRGTKFLVEDIKNMGKKQLVVLTGHGTIQIWEKQ